MEVLRRGGGRLLLTHTAGFSYDDTVPALTSWVWANGRQADFFTGEFVSILVLSSEKSPSQLILPRKPGSDLWSSTLAQNGFTAVE